jgi:hypothetical protein
VGIPPWSLVWNLSWFLDFGEGMRRFRPFKIPYERRCYICPVSILGPAKKRRPFAARPALVRAALANLNSNLGSRARQVQIRSNS